MPATDEAPLQLAYSAGYGVILGLSVFCIAYLRRHQSWAYTGDAEATRKVILPAFEPLFWVLCAIATPYAVYFLWALMNDASKATRSQILPEILLQGRQCIVYIVTIFLHQPNVSLRTLMKSTLYAIVLAGIPVLITAVCSYYDRVEPPQVTSAMCYYLLVAYRIGIVGYYVYLLVRPMSRANCRIIRLFCVYILGFHALAFAFMTIYYQGKIKLASRVVLGTVFYASFTPIWIWFLLKADTQYWRGLVHFNQTSRMDEDVSTKGIHELLESHREYVIDFAHLRLEHKIGVGTNAQVFVGQLHFRYPVAVKVYAPAEITQCTLAEFSQETARCALLKHPNIVQFYGMCVLPPTVCLVTELCHCTLEERLTQPVPFLSQVLMMLDVARAVAFLHSFNPPFVHRDIKPQHILLDHQHNLKLSDFATTRQLSSCNEGDVDRDGCLMTMQGTAEYMAPEMINGGKGKACYRESADIYSLAITFWDILHPGQEKYPASYSNTFRLFELVLDGQRPHLKAELHPALEDLLEGAWCGTPEFRPSAASIVKSLECLQSSLVGGVAHELYRFPFTDLNSTVQSKFTICLSGEALVNCLLDLRHTNSIDESIRLGNALIDSGYLHHDRHNNAFESSKREMYVLKVSETPLDSIREDLSIHGSAERNPIEPIASECDCRRYAQGIYPRHNRRRGSRQKTIDGAQTHLPMLAGLQPAPRSSMDSSISIALLDREMLE